MRPHLRTLTEGARNMHIVQSVDLHAHSDTQSLKHQTLTISNEQTRKYTSQQIILSTGLSKEINNSWVEVGATEDDFHRYQLDHSLTCKVGDCTDIAL